MRLRNHSFRLAFLALVALTLHGGASSLAQEKPAARAPARKLLYPAHMEDVPQRLRPFVTSLLSPEQGTVGACEVKPAGVFARVVTRKYVLDGDRLRAGATLGTAPFVFVTLPESLYGKSLLEVFSTIGYSADDVLTGQLGEEKVLMVFRWEEKVVLHTGRDGALPEAWQTAVYPTTWDNLFAVVEKMVCARDCHYVREKDGRRWPMKLELQSPREVLFVRGYPESGKKRIKASTYSSLRDTGGADWEYRALLERSMGAAEHFTGDGTSERTFVGPGKQAQGFPEFIGPNRELTALPEIVVIGLGALRLGE